MIYEVPFERTAEMADISAEAFIGNNDPIGNFIFDGEPEHLVLKKRFFRGLVTSCSPNAVRQASSDKMEAISIWFPPGMGHNEDVDQDPFTPQDFVHAETMKKLLAVGDVIAALTAELGHEPQWYLHLLAVRTNFKEQGYCSRLIAPVLAKAETEKLPCTLITQSAANARKYEHWGFRVVKEMAVAASLERFYSMRKD